MQTIYRVHNRDGRTCGHNHQSPVTAEACRDSLLDSRCAGCGRKVCRRRACSGTKVHAALWYNSRVQAAEGDDWRNLTDEERQEIDRAEERSANRW